MNTTWRNPPIQELVLGLQHDVVPGFQNADLWRFWHRLEATFPIADLAAPMPQLSEDFSPTAKFSEPMLEFTPIVSHRLQARTMDSHRMFQLQNNWLFMNWMRGIDGDYPGFDRVSGEFQELRGKLDDFLQERGFPATAPTHWEVTYIDHIPKGPLWNSISDTHRVFPGLIGEWPERAVPSLMTLGGTWSFVELGEEVPVRLVLKLQHAKRSHNDEEIIAIHTTARGLTLSPTPEHCRRSLAIGREVIGRTFEAVSSEAALRFWMQGS